MGCAALPSLSPPPLQTTFKDLKGAAQKLETSYRRVSSFAISRLRSMIQTSDLKSGLQATFHGRAYEHHLARSALRRANVDEETWLRVDRCRNAGARHR